MTGRTSMWLAGAGAVAAFLGYAGYQLVQHGAACDSAYRHCAVPEAELDAFLGAWCGPDGSRTAFRRLRAGAYEVEVRRGEARAAAPARFVRDQGRIQWRPYGTDGRPQDGYTPVRVAPDGRLVAGEGTRAVALARCAA